MHHRFLVLIADKKVLRLQQLVKVSLNKGRTIGYVISQVVKAIDGLYRPNPSQDDRELAFLVLKLGGPSLLDILYRAGVLPSVSTAYRMSKNVHPLCHQFKTRSLISSKPIFHSLKLANHRNP